MEVPVQRSTSYCLKTPTESSILQSRHSGQATVLPSTASPKMRLDLVATGLIAPLYAARRHRPTLCQASNLTSLRPFWPSCQSTWDLVRIRNVKRHVLPRFTRLSGRVKRSVATVLAYFAGGTTTMVSPPVLPGSPLAPLAPFEPFEPLVPSLPVAPV